MVIITMIMVGRTMSQSHLRLISSLIMQEDSQVWAVDVSLCLQLRAGMHMVQDLEDKLDHLILDEVCSSM